MRGGPITERVATAQQPSRALMQQAERRVKRTGLHGQPTATGRLLFVTPRKPEPERIRVSERLGRRVEVKTACGTTTILTGECTVRFEGITDFGSKFTVTDGRRKFTLELNASGYKVSTRVKGRKAGISTVAMTRHGYAFETTDKHVVRIVAASEIIAYVKKNTNGKTS